MLQIPTKTKPAYNAGNILTLNQKSQCLASPVAPAKHSTPQLRNLIQKGQKVRIGMVGQLPRLRVALGWNVSNLQCDIDLSASSPNKSVTLHINESSSDREYADIDFFRLDPSIRKIVFVLTINEALERNLNFSMVQDAYIRILNPDSGQEIYSFMLTDYYDNVTSMMLG